MTKITDLTKYKEEHIPHLDGEAVCLSCYHKWIAVAPLGSTWLYCPECNLMRGRLIFPIERKEHLHWACQCGYDLFHCTPDGLYCPNCGLWQKGFDE